MKQYLPVLLLLTGCALTSKGDALNIRWFSPEQIKPRITSAAAQAPAQGAVELGRVSSGFHMREKIMYREATYELGFYEDRRWTERPEVFVRRELARTLYEERGFTRAISGAAPVVDVEVIAFEELRMPRVRAARVQLRVIFHDGRDVLSEETITIDKPFEKNEEFVSAMAEALDAAAGAVADKAAAISATKRAASTP